MSDEDQLRDFVRRGQIPQAAVDKIAPRPTRRSYSETELNIWHTGLMALWAHFRPEQSDGEGNAKG